MRRQSPFNMTPLGGYDSRSHSVGAGVPSLRSSYVEHVEGPSESTYIGTISEYLTAIYRPSDQRRLTETTSKAHHVL